MADTKISAMTAATTLNGTEIALLVQTGNNVQTTASNLVNQTITAAPATTRTALGLGTMALQDATAVAVTGGTINGATVGATTPARVNTNALRTTALTGYLYGNSSTGDVTASTTIPASALGLAYGAWQDSTTQNGSTTVPTVFTFNTTDINDGVTLVSNSRMTVPNTGVYNLQWSGQFSNLDNATTDIWVWIRVNGTDLTGSTGLIGILPRKSAGVPSHVIAGWNYFISLTAGQYVELVWLKEASQVTLTALPASVSPAYPSTASIIATMNQIG